MGLIKTWKRYLLVKILKTFFLILFSFFLLYVLIDFSMHVDDMRQINPSSCADLALYYIMLFSKRFDLLLPATLLITTIKVLISLSQNHELLALQTSGIPLYRLTAPFFFVGLVCVAFSYANIELLIPQSLQYIDQFEKHHFKAKGGRKEKSSSIQGRLLPDGSHLVYQNYDPKQAILFDCFWILSTDELYHMQQLHIANETPIGTFVDEMRRNEKEKIEKVASYPTLVFHNLKLTQSIQEHSKISLQSLSIRDLIKRFLDKDPFSPESDGAIQTHLYFKLLMPWLSILVLISTIPSCVSQVRLLPIFLIFSTSLFFYLTLFTLMNGCLILGEGGVIPPAWAIFTLPIAFCAIFGTRFVNRCFKTIQ